MAFKRLRLDLAFPLPMSAETEVRLTAFIDAAKRLKSHARKINEGLASEEVVIAIEHICHHDTGGKCEPEVEI